MNKKFNIWLNNFITILNKNHNLLQKFLALALVGAVSLSLVEVITYKGALQHNFGLDISILVGLTTLLFTIVLLQLLFPPTKKRIAVNQQLGISGRFSLYFFILLILCYAFFEYLEITNYENFVLAKYQLHYKNLDTTMYVLLISSVFYFYKTSLFNNKQFSNMISSFSIFQATIFIAICLLSISTLFSTFFRAYGGVIQNVEFMGLTYEERMIKALGGTDSFGWIVPFSTFINDHTPEDAILYIPPQTSVWQMTGNGGYMRYFVYPRGQVNTKEIIDEIPGAVTHIVISHGLWPADAERGWPKITIPADEIESITYIDRNTQAISVLEGVDYVNDPHKEEWGVITLKR